MTWKPATIAAISVVDGIVVVENEGDQNALRPPAPLVYWKGTVPPNNAGPGDFYLEVDGSGDVVSVQIFTGSEQPQPLGGEIQATAPITYNSETQTVGWSGTTTDVTEGTNLYYTDQRVDGRIAASDAVVSENVREIVVLSQAQYDNIPVPSPETLYVITE
jgi:hypothetical protein